MLPEADSLGPSRAARDLCCIFSMRSAKAQIRHARIQERFYMAADDEDLPTTYLRYAAAIIVVIAVIVISVFFIVFTR